jgi:CRP/FNR family cyclic AMP-dependent transcriptional regulator
MIPYKTKTARFNPKAFLSQIGTGRKILSVRERNTIFSQGDRCDAVYYIHSGKVKLAVVSATGKEATIGILGPGDFFGEDALLTQHLQLGTATALTQCKIMRVDKNAMLSAIHLERELSEMFVEHLLAKNHRYREDLIDQLFNSSEKRLARILLLFAGFGKDGIRDKTEIPNVSQETLAEMVGASRSRVSSFMNKFRKLGFIDYNGGIEVRSSLLTVVLHE